MDTHATNIVDLRPGGASPSGTTPHPPDEWHWNAIGVVAACIGFDLFCVLAPGALVAGFYLQQSWSWPEVGVAPVLSVACVTLYGLGGAYRSESLLDPRRFVSLRLIMLTCLWAATLAIGFGLKRTTDFSRIWIFSSLLLSLLAIGLAGLMLPRVYRSSRALASLATGYVIIRTGSTFCRLIDGLKLQPPGVILKTLVSRDIDDALSLVEREVAAGHSIIIAAPAVDFRKIVAGLLRYRLCGADILLDISAEVQAGCAGEAAASRFPLFHVIRRPLSDFDIALKRLMDISLASLAAVLIWPALVVISGLILLDDGRPILFRQPRRGFRQQVFEVWKFRTMKARHSDLGAVRQASDDDERLTRIGRVLRASGLDELPQVFIVLQGKMSLVGPRPHALQMTVMGTPVGELVEEYASRHNIRPGMTGLAQVRGFRGPVHDIAHLQGRVESDLEYIEGWKPTLDLWIIVETIKLILSSAMFSKARNKVC